MIDVYERLGDTPPEFNVARNDAVYGKTEGAHTLAHHPTFPCTEIRLFPEPSRDAFGPTGIGSVPRTGRTDGPTTRR
jgi:hypothetical protein